MLKIVNVRSVINIIVLVLTVIAVFLNYGEMTEVSNIVIATLLVVTLVNIFPIRSKVDGELQINDNVNKDIYRFVLYDEPESLGAKEYVKFQVIHTREKHR